MLTDACREVSVGFTNIAGNYITVQPAEQKLWIPRDRKSVGIGSLHQPKSLF